MAYLLQNWVQALRINLLAKHAPQRFKRYSHFFQDALTHPRTEDFELYCQALAQKPGTTLVFLTSMHLSDQQVARLCEVLAVNTDILTIELSGTKMSPTAFQRLSETVVTQTNISQINLRNAVLDDSHLESIINLMDAPNLFMLDLEGITLSASSITRIIDKLELNIKLLTLRCEIEDPDEADRFEFLSQRNATIRKLQLRAPTATATSLEQIALETLIHSASEDILTSMSLSDLNIICGFILLKFSHDMQLHYLASLLEKIPHTHAHREFLLDCIEEQYALLHQETYPDDIEASALSNARH